MQPPMRIFWNLPCLAIAIAGLCLPAISQGQIRPERALVDAPLPALKAFTSEGKAIDLNEHIKGRYTVLKSACLTCPEFLKSYGEIEAAHADYASHCIDFYYVFQSLRHPELGGYVQAQNDKERGLQIVAAKEKLKTTVPWLADTIDDNIRVALRASSQTVYLISPNGHIIYAGNRLDGPALREAIAQEVGYASTYSAPQSLNLPFIGRTPQMVNVDTELQVKRPEGMVILSIKPTHPDKTYYVKLRAEAEPKLLKTGTGRLFLGFYPDPIHKACWNNLTEPMKYELTLPEGVKADPVTAQAKGGPGEKDSQPRQFWVDIESGEAGKTPDKAKLALHYFACTPDMCTALTHEYTIHFTAEDRNSRTFGFNRGKGRPQRGGAQRGQGTQRGQGAQRGQGGQSTLRGQGQRGQGQGGLNRPGAPR